MFVVIIIDLTLVMMMEGIFIDLTLVMMMMLVVIIIDLTLVIMMMTVVIIIELTLVMMPVVVTIPSLLFPRVKEIFLFSPPSLPFFTVNSRLECVFFYLSTISII